MTREMVVHVTEKASVVDALNCPHLLTDDRPQAQFVGLNPGVTTLSLLDGVEHTSRRKRISRALSRRSVEQFGPELAAICDRQLDKIEDLDSVELLSGFALPVCATAAARFLGTTPHTSEDLIALAAVALRPETVEARRRLTLLKLYRILKDTLWAEEDAEAMNNECVARSFVSDDATREDLLGLALPLFVVSELAARSIAACIPAAQSARLSDEEIDRQLGIADIVGVVWRVASSEMVIEGQRVLPDDSVAIHLNEEAGDGARPYPFGFGIHYCLGAAWTRTLVRHATNALWSRFPNSSLLRTTFGGGGLGGPDALEMRLRA